VSKVKKKKKKNTDDLSHS
jgi:hypothetical protein